MVASEKTFWSLHTHSAHSINDAIPQVADIVGKAVEYGYPAIGLTDHRSVSGSVQLYKAARKAGIEPLPGIELDIFPDTEMMQRSGKMHLTVAAYSETGYRNLCRMATLTAQKFWYSARIDFADLAEMAENGMTQGLVVSTGCYFGVLPQILIHHGEAAAVHMAQTLAGWFPRVYVELQNHGVVNHHQEGVEHTDDDVLEGIWSVAQTAGLPVIVARDSHYILEEEKPVHEALKQLVSWSEDPDEAVFPGDGYFMTDTKGLKPYFPPKMLAAGLDGLEELANTAYVRLPELETFSLKMPYVSLAGDDPQHTLETMVLERMTEEEKADPEIMKWVHNEFDVIRLGDMAPYLILCYGVAKFMRDNDIKFIVRGSASGSYTLFKFGVSELDPIKMGLRFDRFLSRNRMKPPDVDFDVEDDRRDEVIAEISRLYATRPVGNHRKYSLTADDGGDGDHSKGSLKERFYSVLRKKGMEKIDWSRIPKRDKDMLFDLGNRKLIAGYGTHAAGYIVAPNQKVLEQLPLVRIASSGLVTAYAKKDVETLGFLKLDLLGAIAQTARKHMEALTGIRFEDIPLEDPETFKMLSAGNTSSVFQFDGWTMTNGAKRLKPKSLEDIIAAQALFRPAPMQAGWTDDYLRRRAKKEGIPKRHLDIMEVTQSTYGILLYQEQVMDIVSLLGFDQVEMEAMLDAVKASNEYSLGAAEALRGMMPRIEALAVGRGWTSGEIDWLVEGLASYAEYSFNRAHAASYGLHAYRTAWMKRHRKVEFWCAVLRAYANSDAAVVRRKTMEARRDGVGFLPPHVNYSGASYTIDPEKQKIRRGLLAVKFVGQKAAHEIEDKAPFTSLTDMGRRCSSVVTGTKDLALKKHPSECGGMVASLYEMNSLEGLEHDDE